MIPIYNMYLGALLFFKKGDIGPNEYGLDPLEAPSHGGALYP